MKIGDRNFNLGEKTFVMGILNVTPDSFSDGGLHNKLNSAISHAKIMLAEGVDIVDVGGESTRPNATFVSAQDELARVIPIIKELKKATYTPISIDTYKAEVAEKALIAGASLVNDIWGLKGDRDMAKVIADYGASVCIMHNRKDRDYHNFIQDVIDDLTQSLEIAVSAGIKKENIILDPGVGFAKSYEQNLAIIKNLDKFKILGYPLLLGVSRKSVIAKTLGEDMESRELGTLATTVLAVQAGVDFVRVHEVKSNKMVAQMADKIWRI